MAKQGSFKPKRGTAAQLANVVLADGEIAFETTNKRIYMGDGTHTVSELEPFMKK